MSYSLAQILSGSVAREMIMEIQILWRSLQFASSR